MNHFSIMAALKGFDSCHNQFWPKLSPLKWPIVRPFTVGCNSNVQQVIDYFDFGIVLGITILYLEVFV